MKILGYLFVTNVAMLLMTMASCAGKDKTSEPLRHQNPSGSQVDSGTTGSVSGTVRLQANPPNRREINMAAVSNCSKQQPSPALTEEVVSGR